MFIVLVAYSSRYIYSPSYYARFYACTSVRSLAVVLFIVYFLTERKISKILKPMQFCILPLDSRTILLKYCSHHCVYCSYPQTRSGSAYWGEAIINHYQYCFSLIFAYKLIINMQFKFSLGDHGVTGRPLCITFPKISIKF